MIDKKIKINPNKLEICRAKLLALSHTRRLRILEFVSNNKGCNNEDICNYLQDRKTNKRHIDMLINQGFLTISHDFQNRNTYSVSKHNAKNIKKVQQFVERII